MCSALSACGGGGGGDSTTPTSVTLKSITVTPTTVTLLVGATQQLTATATYSDGTSSTASNVTWTSSNTSVATIDNTGLAKGIAAGTTTITGTVSGISATTTLTVNAVTLKSITITPTAPSVVLGSTQQFSATGTYSDNSTTSINPTWSSSNSSVATISSTGLVTPVYIGTSTITASSNGVNATTTITVTQATPKSLSITSYPSTSIPAGITATLSAKATMTDGTTSYPNNPVITWSSSNSSIASVNSQGVVTAVAPGSATITANYGAASGTYSFLVNSATIKSIAISGVSATSYPIGGKYPLILNGTYSDNSTFAIANNMTWTSANGQVATVDTQGNISTIGSGTTTVTASYSGLSATPSTIVVAASVAPVITINCNASTPTVISATTWNTAWTADPTNATKWLALDSVSCSSYTSGIVLTTSSSANSIITSTVAEACPISGGTTLQPLATYQSAGAFGSGSKLTSGNILIVGKISGSCGGFSDSYFKINSTTIQ